MIRHLQTRFCIALWLCLLAPSARLFAQPDAPCLEVTLPEGLAQAEEWRAQIALEASPFVADTPTPGACATLQILGDAEEELSIVAGYEQRTARLALVLDDVPEVHHARVAALVAQSLLRDVLVAASSGAQRVAAPPAPSVPAPLPPPTTRRDRGILVQLGSRAFFERVPPLARLELLAQWSMSRIPLRYLAGLLADFTSAGSEQGRLNAGSVGLRVGAALLLFQRERVRLWLGPNAEASTLITATDPKGARPTTHDVRLGAVSADLRLSAELGTHDIARGLVSLDVGGVMHALRLRASGDTIVAYVGVYVGAGVGVVLSL